MVRSIDRGLDVLLLVGSAGHPVPLPEITARLRMPRTTAFNIVRTLTRRGALEAVGERGFRLGPLVKELAQVSGRDLVARARPAAERLAELSAETVMLSVPSGDELVFVDKVESRHAVRYTVQVGTRRPLYCSSHGKVLLATWPEAALQQYLQRIPLVRHTPRTLDDPMQLRRDLARVRQQGYAVSDGEFLVDVYSLSAPISRGVGGPLVAMLGVVAPAPRGKAARRENASHLLECARLASAACADLE